MGRGRKQQQQQQQQEGEEPAGDEEKREEEEVSAGRVARAVQSQVQETFVAFNLPEGAGEADSEWVAGLLEGVPRVYTVEEVSTEPLFAILTTQRPDDLAPVCGRLRNGVILYPARDIMGEEKTQEASNAIQSQLTSSSSSAGGSASSSTAEAQELGLFGKLRRFLVTRVAGRFVTGERLLRRVQNRLEETKSKYKLGELGSAAQETLGLVWTDLKQVLGFDSKVSYVKDKVGALAERLDALQEFAMSGVQHVAAAGKNLYVRVKDHKVVEWGTGKLEEGLQWAEKEGRVIVGTVDEVKEELLREVEAERQKFLLQDIRQGLESRSVPGDAVSSSSS